MQTPYRISARVEAPRIDAARSTVVAVRLGAWLFSAAAAASAAALVLFDGRGANAAIALGSALDVLLWLGAGIASAIIGARANANRVLRVAAVVASAASILGLFVPLVRFIAVATLAMIPMLVAERRVVPRWHAFAVIALGAGRLSRVEEASFLPSMLTIALFSILAHAFFLAARALREESLDERANRFTRDLPKLFGDANARATLLGPIRLAVDVVVAFAIVTLVHSTTLYGFSRSLRLDSPPVSVEASALLLLLVVAAFGARNRSFGPAVAAIVAAGAAALSTATNQNAAADVALLVVSGAVVGIAAVAPRPSADGATTTTRRFLAATSATGVFLGSAGFFALVSYGDGEPALARLAKLAAVVSAIVAARAFAKLESHARVELAAEQRAP